MTRLALIAALAVVPAAAAAEAVTLEVGQYVDQSRGRVLVFSGTIASGAENEVVEVLGRDCVIKGDRLIAATRTMDGGRWRIENPNPNPPWNYTRVESGTTFRARWKGQYSAPQVWRVPLNPSAKKIPGRRARRVHVNPYRAINLSGKVVELQRLSAGQWVRVRRARLVRKASFELGAFNHEAVFAVPTRGLTLRVLLPAKSAAPCFLAGASTQWRS